MRLKSVLVLNDSAHVDGGGSRVGIASAVGLARRGFDVTFLAASGPVAGDLEAALPVVCTGQAKIAEDPRRARAAAQGLWNRQAAAAVRDVLSRRDRHDTVVHVHSWSKALSPSVLHAVRAMGFPAVVTLHDFFAVCPNGSFYDHPAQRICTRKPMSGACVSANCDSRNYPTKLYRVARQLAQQQAAGFPRSVLDYITLSDLSQRVMEPHLPRGSRFHRVRNPIDAIQGPPVDVAANDGFVYVGRLSPEKGVAMLAEAALRTNVPVTFVGEGEERARILNVNPQARVTGWLPAEGVRAELKNARALVLPSLWYEALPLVVMEASSLGVPSVAPDTCGAVEEIEHERTGLVFAGGEIEALCAALERMRDAECAARLGVAAYERYWSKPATLDGHLDALIDVYEKVLGAS